MWWCQHIDANKDGQIDRNELASALSCDAEGADTLINKFDTNGDGMLNEQEWNRLQVTATVARLQKQELQSARQGLTERELQLIARVTRLERIVDDVLCKGKTLSE